MKSRSATKSEMRQMIHDMGVIIGGCQMLLQRLRDEGKVSTEVVVQHNEYINFMLKRSMADLNIPNERDLN
jgi:hypothetical protein